MANVGSSETDSGIGSSAPTYNMKWIKSTHPKEGKWPGIIPGTKEIVEDMVILWEVPVAMRDGAKLYVDIFRPKNSAEEDVPLPAIVTYSPYGKHGPKTFAMFPNSGVPVDSVSKYTVWEGPDPLYWTQRGYAIVNADARGSWRSDGDCTIISPEQAQDGYDLIEWVGTQPWSNGRVGMGGVSYLAIIQWRVAELRPPHLACIVPWEGFTDVYRDYSHHGGIPETNFVKFTLWSCRCGFGRVENWVAMQREHHLVDAYQKTRQARLAQVKCPAYVVADWGDQGLHTRGTLLGFEQISSKQKWLEVHGQKKWKYYYQQNSLHRQEAFYEKFLKGESSEVDHWPRVWLEVRERAFEGRFRKEDEWPIARAEPVIKYLDMESRQLIQEPPRKAAIASYDATKDGHCIDFQCTFSEETEITGSMRLRLWVSADSSADDMDIFVQIDKLESDGVSPVPFLAMSMIDNGPLALGWLRVSHRELDASKSSTFRPFHLHHRELKLAPREIVPIDIEIWPSSTRFSAGNGLRVRLQGNDIFRYDLQQVQLHKDTVNVGKHYFYSGSYYRSYLVMPTIYHKSI